MALLAQAEGWRPTDGGELVLFEPSGEAAMATVSPTFGRMIIFLSELFPHQVLPSLNSGELCCTQSIFLPVGPTWTLTPI